jgi:Protein kinase domain
LACSRSSIPWALGGMGEVYRALDTRLGREVALKTLPAALADQPSRPARLRREAHFLAALSHPHIATLFGLDEIDGVTILVMELVEGPTLADRLRLQPPSIREALELARQIAAGLEGRPRQRDPAPRPETREHRHRPQSPGEAPGLRPGDGVGRQCRGLAPLNRERGAEPGGRGGHGSLHEPRTSAGGDARQADRRLVVRLRAL